MGIPSSLKCWHLSAHGNSSSSSPHPFQFLSSPCPGDSAQLCSHATTIPLLSYQLCHQHVPVQSYRDAGHLQGRYWVPTWPLVLELCPATAVLEGAGALSAPGLARWLRWLKAS